MVDEITPIKPEVKPQAARSIPSSILEEDRGPLNEMFMELVALRNGMAALEAQARQYTAMIDTVKAQMQPMNQQGLELQKQFDARWAEVRAKSGIPDKWEVNTKTGAVSPPQVQQPGR